MPDYDYRQAGAFFVTIVSYQREELFGSLNDQQVCLNTPGQPVWQRNYYEHIIRNNEDLDAIRQYIQGNPVNDEDPDW